MINKFRLLLFALLISSVNHSITAASMRVVYSEGQAFHKSLDKINKLQRGYELNESDTLLLANGGYALIEHDSAMMLEFVGKGIYPLNRAVERIQNRAFDLRAGMTQLDSVIQLLLKKETLPEHAMNPVDLHNKLNTLALYPPATRTIVQDITFKWKALEENTYWLEIFGDGDKLIYAQRLPETEHSVRLSASTFPAERCLYWHVRVDRSEIKSDKRCLFIEDKRESVDDLQLHERFKKELALDSSPMHNYFVAEYFKARELMHLAEDHYTKAWQLSKGADLYKRALNDFLLELSEFQLDE